MAPLVNFSSELFASKLVKSPLCHHSPSEWFWRVGSQGQAPGQEGSAQTRAEPSFSMQENILLPRRTVLCELHSPAC